MQVFEKIWLTLVGEIVSQNGATIETARAHTRDKVARSDHNRIDSADQDPFALSLDRWLTEAFQKPACSSKPNPAFVRAMTACFDPLAISDAIGTSRKARAAG